MICSKAAYVFCNLKKYKKRLEIFTPASYNVRVLAGVAELADALDLGSSVPDVQVQVLSPA